MVWVTQARRFLTYKPVQYTNIRYLLPQLEKNKCKKSTDRLYNRSLPAQLALERTCPDTKTDRSNPLWKEVIVPRTKEYFWHLAASQFLWPRRPWYHFPGPECLRMSLPWHSYIQTSHHIARRGVLYFCTIISPLISPATIVLVRAFVTIYIRADNRATLSLECYRSTDSCVVFPLVSERTHRSFEALTLPLGTVRNDYPKRKVRSECEREVAVACCLTSARAASYKCLHLKRLSKTLANRSLLLQNQRSAPSFLPFHISPLILFGQYIDPIIAATWSEDGAIHDVCKALAPRFREPNSIVSSLFIS